jgi:molecular chaperone DnaK
MSGAAASRARALAGSGGGRDDGRVPEPERRGGPRIAVGLRVRLGYASVDELVERFAVNVSRGGFFVHTREVQPVGTELAFELLLAGGERAVRGRGVVRFVSEPAPPARAAPGMGIAFTALDAPSRALVERMVALREKRGLAPGVGSPAPVVERPALTPAPTRLPSPATADLSLPHAVQAVEAGPVTLELGLCRGAPAEPPSRAVIGIDLGTTNSCAALVRDGKPYVVPSRDGYNTVPSVVAVDARQRLLVGHRARGQLLSNPHATVHGSKRLLGRPYASAAVQALRGQVAYPVVEGADGLAAVELAGHRLSLEEVSALVLREVRDVAQNHLGEPVNRAVVTVPAYYDERQREAVRRAGALAGLHVERVVNEPTAAALAYGWGRALRQRVLVYDLGGGTFDASVLELQDNVYEVVSTGGDPFLGGVDFDARIVARLLERWEEEHGEPFQGDGVTRSRLADAAERAKCDLSARQEHALQLPYLALRDGKPQALEARLTRAEVEALVAPLVDRTLEVCREVLAARGLGPQDLDEIILVGGQSRMPLVHQKVRAFFGKAPSRAVHPDEAVAIGAALLAHALGNAEGLVLVDVVPLTIGLAQPDGSVRPVFERNTPLPARKRYALGTTRDGQTELELTVVQGESPRADGCGYLGTVKLDGLPAGPRGMVKVTVGFELGAEGTLTVTARELQTNRAVRTTFATDARPRPAPAAPPPEVVTATEGLPLAPAAPGAPPARRVGVTAPAPGLWRRLFTREAR